MKMDKSAARASQSEGHSTSARNPERRGRNKAKIIAPRSGSKGEQSLKSQAFAQVDNDQSGFEGPTKDPELIVTFGGKLQTEPYVEKNLDH